MSILIPGDILNHHTQTERKILSKIPEPYMTPSLVRCRKCNYGRSYTCRIRMRIGSKTTVNTGFATGETRTQIQVIVGSLCLSCGNFKHDTQFLELMKKRIREYVKNGYNNDYYNRLLDGLEKIEI